MELTDELIDEIEAVAKAAGSARTINEQYTTGLLFAHKTSPQVVLALIARLREVEGRKGLHG